jgi:hypothetical protein
MDMSSWQEVHDCPSHGPYAAVGRLEDVSIAAED